MKVNFQKESGFSKELKSEVRNYLLTDRCGRFADTPTLIKALGLIATGAALYAAILLAPVDFPGRMILVLFFSFNTLLLGLNVLHEAVHANYSPRPWVNRAIAHIFDVYGISSDLYAIKHIRYHHLYTNIYDIDGDINETPILRMSKDQAWKPIHRYQAFYAPILYSLITITWTLNDMFRLISAKVGKQTFRRPSQTVVVKMLIFKLINLYLTYVLPIHILGFPTAIACILLFHLSLGIILSLIFQVAHVHESGQFSGSNVATDWFTHQLKTSADFSTGSAAVNWLCGGLNLQNIHHLYPHVSYRHYPAIQKIVRALCLKHGIRYVEFPSFGAAVRAHFLWLQRMATEHAI